MKKILISLIVLSIFSCASDDEATENGSGGNQLKSVKISRDGFVSKTINFEYFDNGNIKFISEYDNNYATTTEKTYAYDQDNITTVTVHKVDSFGDTIDEIHTYEYNTANLIVKSCISRVESFSSTNSQVDRIDFVYDANENISNYIHYLYEDADYNTCADVVDLDFTEALEFDAIGNMARYESDLDFMFHSYFTFTYDNKNNPYENLRPINFRNLYISYSTNNIATNTQFDTSNTEIGNGVFEYEYNSDNYPTLLTKTFTVDGYPDVTKIEYGYY